MRDRGILGVADERVIDLHRLVLLGERFLERLVVGISTLTRIHGNGEETLCVRMRTEEEIVDGLRNGRRRLQATDESLYRRDVRCRDHGGRAAARQHLTNGAEGTDSRGESEIHCWLLN